VSTVGCGDAFLAGYTSAFLDKKTPEDCMIRAISTAVDKLSNPLVGYCNPPNISQLSKLVQIISS